MGGWAAFVLPETGQPVGGLSAAAPRWRQMRRARQQVGAAVFTRNAVRVVNSDDLYNDRRHRSGPCECFAEYCVLTETVV